ncbi:hypothetical protein SODALDRAFT_12331 [Sodiomyces alkalinus F11]|uniref:Uncharacterized protein n=1 Tax=Sodiomyces alkalinus (strain CBS 110278 / VKM F-3762 / F11) TaxID=1314773 RepID=A0A3N2Q6H5_SODAK|nr:hypothetical protein SODALDRAFT_12331 [Sodiomyces alkalinus F11]ROT42307.1 hypothetical protein SODALDRAFT_12331 [Sodiomyces alkalinus F11]
MGTAMLSEASLRLRRARPRPRFRGKAGQSACLITIVLQGGNWSRTSRSSCSATRDHAGQPLFFFFSFHYLPHFQLARHFAAWPFGAKLSWASKNGSSFAKACP